MLDEATIVHVRHNGNSPWRHDDSAKEHGGEYVGTVEHGGMTHHAYRFAKARHAARFYAHIRSKGENAHVVREAREKPINDQDLVETFDDVDAACAWAHEAADITGLSFTVAVAQHGIVAFPYASMNDDTVDVVDPFTAPTNEAHIRRRTFSTRLATNRKRSTSTMDHHRRSTAQRAKLWRMRNKSRVKGYQSVYDRPHKAMRESAGIVVEALDRDGLREAFARLRGTPGWVSGGWDRNRIVSEVDPSFVHHAEHYDRLIHGGETFPGGGGLRWGGMVISENEALLRVMGSFEYKPDQEIYQQTIRFTNYPRVVTAEGLSWPDKARLLLMHDDLSVHCDCDAYRFWHQHAATNKGFALVPENRAAPVNNPGGRGGICKHLDLALRYVGGQAMRMASEMKQHHEEADK